MNKLRMIVIIVLAALLAGCGAGKLIGSGNLVTLEKNFTDFDKLNVSNGFKVDIQQGETFSVIIRVDDNLVEYLDVVKRGSTLKIDLKPSLIYRLESVTLEADVTLPELTGADLAGGSHLVGVVETGHATFNLSGGSHVILSGSAGDITVDANGGSHAKLADLAVLDANVEARGGSHVTVNPTGQLDTIARGGSHVKYIGTPTLGIVDDDDSSWIQKQW
ncbi:MAG: DUF2807 domain-containing protein [Anaerolineaceae bacterium]|nr:MAG: DUF2807 domain-containing protein [Anaerolineaceae bacterium]